MPSQLFDNGEGAYEVPSGERLTFKAGEGADASYNLPSAFQRAMTPSQSNKSAAMGSSDRFNSPGSYIKNTGGAPGPGAYTHQAQAKPSSRYGVMGPENTRASVDRLKFEGVGQGADAVYSLQSAFGDVSSPTKTRGGAGGLGGSSKRFGAVNSYLAMAYSDAPGPGAYSAKAGQIQAEKKAGAPPPSRDAGRLTFAPSSGMGESPGAVYKIESTFDLAADKAMRSSRSTGFGKSDRFHSPGSYLKNGDTPGPGAYTSPDNPKPRPASAPLSGRPAHRTVDFGPSGEGADPAYDIKSAFEKAAAKPSNYKPSSAFGTTSRFDKHGSYAAKAASSEPGPGTYTSPHKTITSQRSFSSRPPQTSPPKDVSKGRVDFGPVGEGAAAMYDIKSSFDSQGQGSKGAHSSCFGSSKRFQGAGSYTNPTSSPGPGAYASRECHRRSAPQAAFASPKMRPPGWSNRPRSALNSSSSIYKLNASSSTPNVSYKR